MKAIILASGMGKRLMPLTDNLPKPLVKVGDFTILERIVDSLIENDVRDIIVTTGHCAEKIEDFLKQRYQGLNFTFVNNPLYSQTNYIYSLWLAQEKATEGNDIIWMHGDLLYDPSLLRAVLSQKKSAVLIKRSGILPQKDFKAKIEDGLVTQIGVNIFGPDARFCIPLYKFLSQDFNLFAQGIERFIKDNKLDCYAENVFNGIPELKLVPVYYDNELAMEIDDFEDLAKAQRFLKNLSS